MSQQPGTTIDRAAAGSLVAMPTVGLLGQATAVEVARAVAEVQAAVLVAQQCPRDMNRAWAEMRLACGRTSLAEHAFYAVDNRGSGASIHLARELARIWGNLDYGVRELRRDDAAGISEILAYAWDQQTNVRPTRSIILPHARMVKKQRVALTDLGDIYLNNQNVGARAVRMCIFAVLPADYRAEAEEICRKTLRDGDGQPLEKRIENMLARFAERGIKLAQIEARVGRKRGQWNAADLADLGIVFRSIERGETSVEEQFPQVVTAAEIQAAAAAAAPGPAQATDRPAGAQAPTNEAQPEPPATEEPAAQGSDSGWPDVAQPPDAPARKGRGRPTGDEAQP